MSYFGVVVSGVGSLHAAGGVAATLQALAAAPVLTMAAPVAGVAATIAVAEVVRRQIVRSKL
jgi:hypothetical protein